MTYCADLATTGGAKVAQILGTEVLENEERSLGRCCFANVRLPLRVGEGKGEVREGDRAAVTQWLVKTMVDEFCTFMALCFYAGNWWVRLSGQVYLELSDFEWAGGVLGELCGRIEEGVWR